MTARCWDTNRFRTCCRAFDWEKVSSVPVIASHSSARHFTPDFERNMDDDMSRANELLDEALITAHELGMHGLIERIKNNSGDY